jgi:hypothetical protein
MKGSQDEEQKMCSLYIEAHSQAIFCYNVLSIGSLQYTVAARQVEKSGRNEK